MNIQRVTIALQRVNYELSKGPNYLGAHQLKLLRKTKAKLTRQLNQFINPAAPARPLPKRALPVLPPIRFGEGQGEAQTTLSL